MKTEKQNTKYLFKLMNKEIPKLTKRGYELTKKLFDIYYPQNKKEEKEKIETRSRVTEQLIILNLIK